MMSRGNRNDFYSTARLNSCLGYFPRQQMLRLTGSSLDTNSITFFVLHSPIITMYDFKEATAPHFGHSDVVFDLFKVADLCRIFSKTGSDTSRSVLICGKEKGSPKKCHNRAKEIYLQ